MLDDRFRKEGVGRIGAALTTVVCRLAEVPQVIDHACANKRASFMIEGHSPWIAGTLAEQFKLFRARIDTKQSAGKIKSFTILLDDRSIEYTIESVKISVGSPCQCAGKLVRIVATKTSNDNGLLVGFVISIGIFQEQDVRRIGNPDTTISDSDSRRYVQTLRKDLDGFRKTITILVLKYLDRIASWPRFTARIFKTLGHIDTARVIERHCDWILNRRFCGN